MESNQTAHLYLIRTIFKNKVNNLTGHVLKSTAHVSMEKSEKSVLLLFHGPSINLHSIPYLISRAQHVPFEVSLLIAPCLRAASCLLPIPPFIQRDKSSARRLHVIFFTVKTVSRDSKNQLSDSMHLSRHICISSII